jgi:FKBP-type peptidyl-prolyl cis-trans isomerase FkpA
MKMIKPTNALIGLLMFCIGCNDSANEKKTPNGFTFKVIEQGNGVYAKPQQLLVFDYVIKDSKDSIWESTYESMLPAVVGIQDTTAIPTETGMIQLFRQISVGDSINVTKPARSFFKEVWGGRPFIPGMDTSMTFTCDIRAKQIIEMQDYEKFMDQILAKKKGPQKIKDQKLIEEFLTKNNIKAETDTAGIHFVMHANSGGRKPSLTDCVEVKYHGKFLKTGETFDQGDKVAFPLNGNLIRGWKLAVPKLGIGDSATFYIPSHLCYGPQGQRGGIPPDAILVFDITLLNASGGYDEVNRICN